MDESFLRQSTSKVVLNERWYRHCVSIHLCSRGFDSCGCWSHGPENGSTNPNALTSGDPNQELGTPVMQPLSGACGASGGAGIPAPNVLRFDDIAALNRMYPITAGNLASFPGKELTAANTVSFDGTLTFRSGAGCKV